MPTPALAQLTNGLAAYFDFQTATISNVVAGTSGFTPAITLTGTPVSGFTGSASRPLLVGNAANLIRTENDYFTITNIGSGAASPAGGLNLGGTFTLSSWHYLNPAAGSPTGNRYFVWEGAADYDVSYGTGGNTSGPDSYTAYTTTATNRPVSLPRNTWNNIVQSFSNDGTNITSNLYINGQFIGSNTTLLANMSWAGLRYGNSRSGGGRAWDGTLDEIGIYTSALNPFEVRAAYQRGLTGVSLTAAGADLVAWTPPATGTAWLAGGDWGGSSPPGVTGNPSSGNTTVAHIGGYSSAGIGTSGLGIDMAAADGSLALGAISLNSPAAGTVRIGNSAATPGLLRLNGGPSAVGNDLILAVAGQTDLDIAGTTGGGTLGLELGNGTNRIQVLPGRTATISAAITEAAAGSSLEVFGGGTVVLGGANAYTGGTTVSAGALVLASTAAAPAGGTITVADAAGLGLAVGGSGGFTTSDFLSLFAGTFPGVSLGANSTAGIDTTAGHVSLAGDLAGVRGLAKFGPNTLTVTGTNSYSGATTVFAGTLAIGDGGTSGTLPGNATVTGTLAFDRADDLTYSGTISGPGSMVKRGAGTLTLTAAQTFAGGTTVAGGTLAIGTGGATNAAAPVTVQDGGTLRFDRNDTWGAASVATTPLVTIDAGGTVRSSSSYTTVVSPVFNGGTLEANGGANTNFPTFGLKGTVAVNATAGGSQITTSGSGDFNTVAIGTGAANGTTTFNVANGAAVADLAVAAPLTDLGGLASNLVKSGSGTMAFTAASRYTGTTTINAGTLSVGTGGSLYFTGTLFGGTGATNLFVNTGATLETRNWDYGDGNALNQLRANSYAIRIDGGTVRFSQSFNSVRGFQVGASGATLEAPAGVTYSKDLGTAVGENLITGQGTGGGGRLTLTGAGTGTIQDPLGSTGTWSAAAGVTKTGPGTWTLAATNVYTGATTVSGGTLAGSVAGAFGCGTTSVAAGATLRLGHSEALAGSTLVVDALGGTIDYAAGSTTYAIGGLSGTDPFDAAGNSLAVGGANVSSSFAGALAAAALEKTGSGTFTVTGAAAPTAGTTVSGGTLRIGDGGTSGTLAGDVTTNATLAFARSDAQTFAGTISGGGEVRKSGSGNLTLSGANSHAGGTVVEVGTLVATTPTALGTGVLTTLVGTTVNLAAPGTNTYAVDGLVGTGTIAAGDNSLVVGGLGGSSRFSGTLIAASLTKQGSGTLTLSGSSTLNAVRIEAGGLFVNSATAIGTAAVTLAGGGLLVANGDTFSRPIVLDGPASGNSLGSAVAIDYLVVGGGGGGGGRDASGGGGAGGVLSNLVSAGLSPIVAEVGDSFAATVGGGGAGGGATVSGGTGGQGTNGDPSSFATVTALGGGGGGAYNTGGKDGASGGGAGRGPASGGVGTAGQGFAGGNGLGSTNNDTGAGGGGAGAAGSNGRQSGPAGSGGSGSAVPIVSTALAAELAIGQVSGASVFFGGGGGGTPHRNATTLASGLGGLGGGGAGSVNATDSFATPGAVNTGGGGGASRTDNGTRGIGGAGGSGVVVVRYGGDQAFTGGDDVRTESGFTYHTFKTVGSSSLQYLGGDATISSAIGGTGGFTWDSAGTLTLSGTNSFQGGAIISAGTLVAASAAALGTGTATVASGARLRLDPAAILANPIANLGSGSFLGSLDFAGGGLARTSSAGGTTLGTLLAGSSNSAATLNPAISWLAQTSATASDILQLTNTSGTAQVLSLTYDPLLAPASPQEAYLGWFDTNTTDWVNAIDGNSGGTGSFFQGSWLAYLAANPGATPTSALGTYGHDSATNSVWAVVNHNSDFAVIVVPEPGTLALAGLGLAGLAALLRRRGASCVRIFSLPK